MSLFFDKVAEKRKEIFISKETLAQVFWCEFCKNFKSNFFTDHLFYRRPPVYASGHLILHVFFRSISKYLNLLLRQLKEVNKSDCAVHINPFHSTDLLWYHLKTRAFLMFSGGIKKYQLHEMVNLRSLPSMQHLTHFMPLVSFYTLFLWRSGVVFFKHFASKNQLPGFYISRTLVENGLS